MTFQYQYGIYNPGQYPAEIQETWDALVADGWQVNTAVPAYNEIYILWQRELPVPEPAAKEETPYYPAARDVLGRFQVAGDDQTSGDLQAHEGQDAR